MLQLTATISEELHAEPDTPLVQEYEDPAHAAEAVAKYNEGHFLGSQIKVELSLARTDLPKESGSADELLCGRPES